MRKKVFGYQLSRDKNERKALFRGLFASLIQNGELTTTLPKAKAIQGQMEKLITKAKKGSLSERRALLGILTKRVLVNKLAEVIAPVFKERRGGYTRIVKIGSRQGDRAAMARISFTEEIPLEVKKEILPKEQTTEPKKAKGSGKTGKNDKINKKVTN